MNKKLIILLAAILTVIIVGLVGKYGCNPYSTKDVQATYLRLSSEDLQFKEDEDGNTLYYYYIKKLEADESYGINLSDFVDLDPDAINDKSTLGYSIIYDEDAEECLDLVTTGPLKGRLTISGQASASITISTTDGSGIEVQLFIRPYVSNIDEHHGDDGFK